MMETKVKAMFFCRGCRKISRKTVIKNGYIAEIVCDCGTKVRGREIIGIRNDAKKCDGRCTAAVGCQCECSCGGENHGSDHGN